MLEKVLPMLRLKGYEIDGKEFLTGLSTRFTLPLVTKEGVPVVGKFYPLGGGGETFDNMQRIWNSSFGRHRQPPGLPKPLMYLHDIDVLIMERIEGHPLLEIDPFCISTINEAIKLLVSFQKSDSSSPKERSAHRIIKSLKRKADRIAEISPNFFKLFNGVVEGLRNKKKKKETLVPCHGDFSPRNILVAPNRLVFIDWDRFRKADPARDIAYMGCWYWILGLRQSKTPDWSFLGKITKQYNILYPQSKIQEQLRFHIAAGLLREAHNRIENLQEETQLVPKIIAEAQNQLR